MTVAVQLHHLQFAFGRAPALLDIAELRVAVGERLFLFGPSGSGKSTLLGLLGGVRQPQQGSISVLGTELTRLSGMARDRFRAQHIGFVFQQFNLLPYLSLLDNVLLPCRFSSVRAARARAAHGSLQAHADFLLGALGLAGRLQGRPVTGLSVGQQQRVAVARALAGAPELLICDEPTSALDHDARSAFLELLFGQCERVGSTLIFVSHDRSLSAAFGRSLDLRELNRAAAATS